MDGQRFSSSNEKHDTIHNSEENFDGEKERNTSLPKAMERVNFTKYAF